MTKESVEKALKRVNRGIVIATVNIEKGVQVEKSKDGIEDLNVCKEALNKQLERKVIEVQDGKGKCPVCGEILHTGFMESNYCHWCGSKLTEF